MVKGKNAYEISKRLENEMLGLCNWMVDNSLSLHCGKTEYILFGTKKNCSKYKVSELKIGDNLIKNKDKVKYLGGILYSGLTEVDMVNKMITKVNSGLKFVCRKGAFLDSKLPKSISISLLQPHFDYGCIYWYLGLNKTLCNKLQVTQNKIVRFILCKGSRFHLEGHHFRKLNILKVNDRVEYLMLNLMHSIFYGSAPSYLCNTFKIRESGDQFIRTRHSVNSFYLPKVNTHGIKTLRFKGVRLWNGLNNDLKQCRGKAAFKRKLKNLFLSRDAERTWRFLSNYR